MNNTERSPDHHLHFLLFLFVLGLAMIFTSACGDDDPPPAGNNTSSLEYWRDVAPIYYENCVTCHQVGGIAPFRLDRYEEARTWAGAAKLAVESRTMPPWLVTGDGSCGEFSHSRWMDDAEIQKISRWAEAGAPEGTPRTDLLLPDRPGLTDAITVETPLFTPEIAGGMFAEFDEYRCFLIDPQLTQDQFITGYEVLPGDEAIVHHVLLMPVDPDAEVEPGVTTRSIMQTLDDESPDREGWPCYGLAGENVAVDGVPVTWAPGMGVVEYPAQTGVNLPSNRMLVVQLHYNLADPALRGRSDSTQVRLRLATEVERVGFFVLPDLFLDSLFSGQPAQLAPGRESVEYTWSTTFDDELQALGVEGVDVYGVFPHMHERGRKWRLEIGQPDARSCAGEVKVWDFAWQYFYFYEQPFEIAMGTEVHVTCTFDTRGLSDPVLPGWGTQNEMCLAGLYVVPRLPQPN